MHWLIEILFPRRLHRLAYCIRGTALEITQAFLCDNNDMMNLGFVFGSVFVLCLYQIFFVAVPRLRDIGMSGWWLLLGIVPVADMALGVVMLFRPPWYRLALNPSVEPVNHPDAAAPLIGPS